MTAPVRIIVNGNEHQVADGVTLAAALLNAGYRAFRNSVGGDPRGPVCGMGTCFECRVTINGAPDLRACLVLVHEGMSVVLGE